MSSGRLGVSRRRGETDVGGQGGGRVSWARGEMDAGGWAYRGHEGKRMRAAGAAAERRGDMYWYIGGGVLCALAAYRLKRKFPGQKNLYEAVFVMAAGFLMAAALTMADGGGEDGGIERNAPGMGSVEKEYEVSADGVLDHYPIQIEAEETRLSGAQRKERFEKAKRELDELILGNNESPDEVTEALFLPDTLQDGSVEAEYSFSDYDVFEPDGTLAGEVKEPVIVEVTAELSCQEETCLYSFPVRAVPREKSETELFVDRIKDAVSEENRREDSAVLELPQEIGGTSLSWKEKKQNRGAWMALLGCVAAVAIFFREKEEKKRAETDRDRQMMADYPEIVSKLSLLLGAGMNLTMAWERIAYAYQEKRDRGEIKPRHAYEEMLTAIRRKKEGVSELQAIADFGESCRLSAYRRLSSLIVQNVRKGARGMQRLLEEEERDALEEQKARARKAGEEAGTKMLLPMGMMLIIVLVILIVPAGMSMSMSVS